MEQKLKFLLRTHKCTCPFTLTFRYLPIKYKRTKRTQIFYVSSMVMLLYIHLTLVIPFSPASTFTYIETLVHILVWIITAISFFLASCKDPGYLKQEYQLMHLLENFHSDDICPRCEVLTTPRSHHCAICDRCVERWDHHCPWINNCVGVSNGNYFMAMLVSTCLLFLLYIEPPITAGILHA